MREQALAVQQQAGHECEHLGVTDLRVELQTPGSYRLASLVANPLKKGYMPQKRREGYEHQQAFWFI